MKRKIITILSFVMTALLVFSACNPRGLGWASYKSERKAASPVKGRTIDTKAKAQPATAEEFTVSGYFGDDMIVPREKEITIWGSAPLSQNGKVVSATFKGLEGSAVIADGKWKISLNGTLPASAEKGNSLIVSGKSTSYEYKDVLVGDIWLLNGQSNADLTFNGSTQQSQMDLAELTKEDLANATADDNIRLFRQSSHVYGGYTYDYALETPQYDTIPEFKWTNAEKKHLNGSGNDAFPLLGYYFAKYMMEANKDVPIGIITSSWGGATLQSLSSPDAIAKYPDPIKNFNFVVHNGSMAPGGIYNAFISPVTNVEITGMVYFQGESEGHLSDFYADALKIYAEDLREKFNTNFTFLNVQVSSYGYYAGNVYIGVGGWETMNLLRYSQAEVKIDNSINDYEIIPSYDLGFREGDGDGAHPYYKKELGERIAKLAAAKVYGIGSEDDAGCPIPARIDHKKNKVYITYDYVGGGLKTKDGRTYISGFEILVNGGWYEATAELVSSNEIMIEEDEDIITGVRYATYNRYDANALSQTSLISGTGNPAAAFQVRWDKAD